MVALADFPRQNGVSADNVDGNPAQTNQPGLASDSKLAPADKTIQLFKQSH
jgi:hypothetical protein